MNEWSACGEDLLAELAAQPGAPVIDPASATYDHLASLLGEICSLVVSRPELGRRLIDEASGRRTFTTYSTFPPLTVTTTSHERREALRTVFTLIVAFEGVLMLKRPELAGTIDLLVGAVSTAWICAERVQAQVDKHDRR